MWVLNGPAGMMGGERELCRKHHYHPSVCSKGGLTSPHFLAAAAAAALPGSETPSRTSWSHFFVKDAARQVLIMSAESQIEALFKSNAVRGPFPPLAKVEALQSEQEGWCWLCCYLSDQLSVGAMVTMRCCSTIWYLVLMCWLHESPAHGWKWLMACCC